MGHLLTGPATFRFAGGSAVCCVDEVSTGLDPISRRRIWEILLAERQRRTIIMTTHFLDEADYLADDIAIMYKGTLRAAGTAASLKHQYGDGYTIKLPYETDIKMELPEAVQTEHSRHQTVYRVTSAAIAAGLTERLDEYQLRDYQISGPTMEELFLKVTGDKIYTSETDASKEETTKTKDESVTVNVTDTEYELDAGQPISVFKQWSILFGKRLRILKRRYVPYFVAVAFAIVGAAIAPLLIKSFRVPIACPTPESLVDNSESRSDFGTSYYGYSSYGDSDTTSIYQKVYVFGPASKLNDSTISDRIEMMANVYSKNHTKRYSANYPRGYSNGSQIIEQMLLVNTYDEFSHAVQNNWKAQAERYALEDSFSPYSTLKGGIWLGDKDSTPTIMANARQIDYFGEITNFANLMYSGTPISMAYDNFASTTIPSLIDFTPLMFIVYYGLIMCW